MGKRNNRDAVVGRRRPMIQLGSQKSGIGAVSRTNFKDEENVKEEPSTDKIDVELAGFLAEINSLEGSSSYDASATKQTNGDPANLIYDPTTFDPATQAHLLPEPWQACYDESTSYYYYWNTSTNEVQWYPPVSTVPPPPPPPDDDVQNPVNLPKEPDTIPSEPKEENMNELLSQNEEENEKTDDNTEKQIDDVEGGECGNKMKDRELMSQIKEKIQRKKEEKEREQKEKEEQLREKLIQKKIEREKVEDGENEEGVSQIDKKEEPSRKRINEDESFSLDIFANEDVSKLKLHPKVESESEEVNAEDRTNTNTTETTDDSEEKLASNPKPENTDCEMDESNKKIETSQKDLKGSWRIIDAVYDDDGEDNSDVNNVESEEESSVKSAVEMDDYADMLLEDGIGEKEDEKTKINSTAKEIVQPILPPEMPPPPPQDDIKPPLPPEDEPLPEPPKISSEQEEKARKEVSEKSTQLFEKLDFLGITSNELRNLQIRFIELETRIKDWQAGALDSQYFLKSLSDLDSQIVKYEETAAPTGWLCHWSSEFKRYYYHNTLTGESQWEYPEVVQHTGIAMNPTDYHTAQMLTMQAAAMMNPMMSYMAAAMPVVSTTTEKPATISETAASLVSPAHGFTRDPIPTETKKRPAQDESMTDPYGDPYRKKKKEMNSNENALVSGNEQGSSSPLAKSVIAAAPVIRNTSREASPAINTFTSDDVSEGSASPLPLPTAKMTVANAKAKMKKKKKMETSGLPSKKLKQVSSLVQKWQTVKQKVEEEENIEEESEDEDYEAQSERRISEWKRDLELSGRKDLNPNFTEIKGNWRERLKRKTTS